MPIDTTKRSTAPEIMDDFAMEGDILTDALDKIAAINKLLGGNKVTLEGIRMLMKNNQTAKLRITDVGCGNGAMLRMLSDYAKKHKLNFELKGIDANKCTIDHAISCSQAYPEIRYQCSDIFDESKEPETCDVMLFTLTLHHFSDSEIIKLLNNLRKGVFVGIVVNDLQRSSIAYRLFTALSYVFRLNDMSREDGLVSILRGFKREDLNGYTKALNTTSSYIGWRWAFRYLWVIKTI
ncbi:methyltransferase domain-containing protein [Pedobacter sp. Leaf194]|uniref:methyltransferase domain-containing protein n=1 Tax=Pedobacter sp. Leaf194 TaxID=1736297 RepID=UPI000702FBEC|nr:methyltransferase domain-containing protein [Pedobacter sp. Leaf194]KQS36299.1 methyltransferase [Pedobacter sp. Leaf194]